jgi:hypothetical protein
MFYFEGLRNLLTPTIRKPKKVPKDRGIYLNSAPCGAVSDRLKIKVKAVNPFGSKAG